MTDQNDGSERAHPEWPAQPGVDVGCDDRGCATCYEQNADSVPYPIVKFGARWVCDGPDGRFHTRTKREAEELLAEALARTFACPDCGGEMIRSPRDLTFLMHAESTDCAPEPWPTTAEQNADSVRSDGWSVRELDGGRFAIYAPTWVTPTGYRNTYDEAVQFVRDRTEQNDGSSRG